MKNTFRYLFVFACSLATVVSCARFDEQDDAPVAEPKVKMTFTAEIEGDIDADTKTTLGGQMGDQYRKVLWEPGDSVGITNSIWYNHMDKFINTEVGTSEVATFEGSTNYGDTYYLFYPYHENLYCEGNSTVRFNLPAGQRYRNQSFDSGSMPMVAKGNRTERFQFQSLCGVLALNLTGSEIVKSVSFSGRDASGNPIPVAGTFYVGMNYESYPEITAGKDAMDLGTLTTITLDCGDGVQINPSEATPFYIVLPVGTYNEFSVVVATTDGKLMLKESKNPLTIKRANVTKTGALAYVADVAVDLSEIGHSNCYIVPESGLYSFDADVIGNGEYGLVESAKFHTTDTSIDPESVELVWEDKPGVIAGLAFDGQKVSFMSTGIKGNALIAVKDANNKILWSWHIWSTDQPQEQVYVNERGTFIVLDRNIGATQSYYGDETTWHNSIGVRYQWGRKDPFANNYSSISSEITIEESINIPTTFVSHWNFWCLNGNDYLWSSTQKTIYDPCPVGYRVAVSDIWDGFTSDGNEANRVNQMNVTGTFNSGWNIYYDGSGSNTTWYPLTDWSYGRYLSASRYTTLLFYYSSEYECILNPDYGMDYYDYHNIRCMKDEGHVDISYPTVKITSIKDISSVGASILAKVSDEGVSEVIERGIIWGTSEDINLENADRKTSDSAGFGEYTISLDGLSHSTRYYVRAYATNERGTSYSDVKSFYTPFEGDAVNLSRNGTANCYIVPVAYSDYIFNASVKGNSDESVGAIASAEVLWETRNTSSAIEVGDVIETVLLDGNNVRFRLPFDPVPGNAMIAVKDALGTILWSWHIWVVDFDPEETQCKYISGAVMMDRNLGALSIIPAESMSGDYGAYGLYYQWGRKDPIVSIGTIVPSDAIQLRQFEEQGNSIEFTINNPTIVVDDINWNGDNTLWGVKKTIYDPCPYGWRVAEPTVWESISSGDVSYQYSYVTIPEPYSVPAAYYPLAGRSDWINSYLDWRDDYGLYRTTDSGNVMRMDRHNNNFYLYGSIYVDQRASVRCMKDIWNDKPGSGDDVIVDDEYGWND